MAPIARHLIVWLTIGTFLGLALLIANAGMVPPLLVVFFVAVPGTFFVYGPLLNWLDEQEYLD